MKGKPFLKIVVISLCLASMLVGVQFVQVTEAYPGQYYFFRPNPDMVLANPPTVVIRSPQNGTYGSNSILFSFSAETSSLDDRVELCRIVYYLDGVQNMVFSSAITLGPTFYNWYKTLNLTQGMHSVRVVAFARSYSSAQGDSAFDQATEGFSDEVVFTIAPVPAPTASPTAPPTPTPSPSFTLVPTSTPVSSILPTASPLVVPISKQQIGFMMTGIPKQVGYAIEVAFVLMAVVAAGLLVYFRKLELDEIRDADRLKSSGLV